MSTQRRWKQHERQVAQRLGTRRNPNTGRRRADIDEGIPWSIEHKTRKEMPAWFVHAMDQAIAGAMGDRTPIVVIDHCRGRGHRTQRYVVMLFSDFEQWHGRMMQ